MNPYRHHEQTALRAPNGRSVDVDRGIAPLIQLLWGRGISTQSSCQQDYIRVDGQVLVSHHAYVGFSGSQDLRRFLMALAQGNAGVARAAISDAAACKPGFGNGYEADTVGDYRMPSLGSAWGYAVEPWVASEGVSHLGITLHVSIPVNELHVVTAALQ